MSDMQRLNVRVSKSINDWLDARSKETGISKSSLVFLALEQYKRDTSVIENMDKFQSVYEKLEDLEKRLANGRISE